MPHPCSAADASASRDESPVSAIFRSAAASYPTKDHPFRLPSTLPCSPYPSRFPPLLYIGASSSSESDDTLVSGTVTCETSSRSLQQAIAPANVGFLKSCPPQTPISGVAFVCDDEMLSRNEHHPSATILQGLQDENILNLARIDSQKSIESICEKKRDIHTQNCNFSTWNRTKRPDIIIKPEPNGRKEANAAEKQPSASGPDEADKRVSFEPQTLAASGNRASEDSSVCRRILVSSKWDDADKWLRNHEEISIPEDKRSAQTGKSEQSIDHGTNSEGIHHINPSKWNHKMYSPPYSKNENGCFPNFTSDGFLCNDSKAKDNSRPSIHRRYMSMGNADMFWNPHSDAIMGTHLQEVDNVSLRNSEALSAANYSLHDYDFKSIEVDYNVKQYRILENLNRKGVKHDRSGSISVGAVDENYSRLSKKDVQAKQQKEPEKRALGRASLQSLEVMKQIESSLQHGSERMKPVMKDVGTEMTPSISSRHALLGSETTPFSTSTTSNSISPMKLDPVESPSNCASSNGSSHTSPACRYNTPARMSMSYHGFSDTLENHLELEECHFAKLGLKLADSHSLSLDMTYRTKNAHVVLSNSLSPSGARVEDSQVADGNHSSSILQEYNHVEARAAAWQEAEKAKLNAKYKCEQAKIDAWKDLQRAKAEAELKKLEMKLEKMRSRATEKLMSKVESANKRAAEMKAYAKAQQIEQLKKVAEKASVMLKDHVTDGLAVCFTRSRT